MAYVQGFDYDIFISYAHIDDEGDERWVTHFVGDLTSSLKKRLGTDKIEIFQDIRKLQGHGPVEQLKRKAERSALFVPIVTPGYVSRPWTTAELNAFCTGADRLERIFAIEMLPLDNDADYPAPLRKLLRTRFWSRPTPSAVPLTIDRKDYKKELEGFAEALRIKLIAMRNGGAGVEPLATIVMAQVTPDLERDRRLVKSYLEQFNIKVLPEDSYPGGGAEFAAAFAADCARATHFVQLLGPWADRRPGDLPEGYALHQYQAAKKAGLVPLLWCRPDLPREEREAHDDALLFQAPELIASGLEDFKSEVLRQATRPAARPPGESPAGDGFIFVNNDKADQTLAQELAAEIARRKKRAFLRAFEGEPADLLNDLEESIVDCSALVVVYGQAQPMFVRAQLRLCDKLGPRRNGRPLKVLAVYANPPAEEKKKQLGVVSHDLVWIDAAQDRDALLDQMIRALDS